MNRWTFRVLAVVVLIFMSGCSAGTDALPINNIEIVGPGTLGLSVEGKEVKRIAVYFHGMDQDEQVVHVDDKHAKLTEALLRDGYAVVSSIAGGNALGNPQSQQAYRDLIANAKIKYATSNVVFVAESMGGLAALNLLNDPQVGGVHSYVGISPIMGMPEGARLLDFVLAAWGGNPPPDSADPMSWPVERLDGVRFQLYTGDSDDVIPPGATAQDFAGRYQASNDIQIKQCVGGHVADRCFDGDEVVKWLDAPT